MGKKKPQFSYTHSINVLDERNGPNEPDAGQKCTLRYSWGGVQEKKKISVSIES